MIFIEVLVEGTSDVPVVREVMTRHLCLRENEHFRIHPHRGKGSLPTDLLGPPDPRNRTLLHQLPAKLRGLSQVAVVVLVDADEDDCIQLKQSLVSMLERLRTRPSHVLFRIAVEEVESWFIADVDAVRQAYPTSNAPLLGRIRPDQVCGAWEQLARALGLSERCSGAEKVEWAERISPFLDLNEVRSPSFRAFLNGLEDMVTRMRETEE